MSWQPAGPDTSCKTPASRKGRRRVALMTYAGYKGNVQHHERHCLSSSSGDHQYEEAGLEKLRRLAPPWLAPARVITVLALAASCLTVAGTSADAANLE